MKAYMVLQDKKHPLFERRQYDIYYTLRVDASKILFNEDVVIPTLSPDETITIHWSDLPQPIHSKTQWVVQNKGLYCDTEKTKRGNLIVQFQIEARVLQQQNPSSSPPLPSQPPSRSKE